MLLRLLVVLWALSGLFIAWLRYRSTGFKMAHVRTDVMAAILLGTFVWAIVAFAI